MCAVLLVLAASVGFSHALGGRLADLGTLYLVALCIGLGTIIVQLMLSTDKDVSHGAFEVDGDAHAGGDVLVDVDADHGDDVAHGMAPLAILLSLRFWTFALMAFGMFGSFMHFLDLAAPMVTLGSAGVLGFVSGWLASWTFFKLSTSVPNSGAESTELLGQVGKVILPPNEAGRSKVRFRVKGQIIDYLATADDTLEPGASVMVEEVRGEQVHVSAAPAGLEYTE
jgi:membrane protein implicated in regulation of membrane protease activity